MSVYWSADDIHVRTVYSYRNGQEVIVCVYARRMRFIDPITTWGTIDDPLYGETMDSRATSVLYNSYDYRHCVHVPVSNHHAFARELMGNAC